MGSLGMRNFNQGYSTGAKMTWRLQEPDNESKGGCTAQLFVHIALSYLACIALDLSSNVGEGGGGCLGLR